MTFDPARLRTEQAKQLGFDLEELGPGVYGRAYDIGDGVMVVPTVWSPDSGKGNVSRWLDGLPRDKTVVFIEVINVKLAGMLERRGFLRGQVVLEGGVADVHMRVAE